MPRPELSVVNFSYLHWPVAKADPEGVARDLAEHYVDTQVVISSYLPNPIADSQGKLTQPMDFSKLDAYMTYNLDSPLTWPEESLTKDVMCNEELIKFHVCINPFYNETAHYADIVLRD